ncbi:hypothetical protein [Streptomyces sp. NBC_00316]|uniref:hypothetical protein n=1 Tax=Streptomyces sp. NBC_00316 TaxID=2975710 RepID=UPI002E2DFBF7|nr:hypothetical protein [Streptomyces sp. NBC_00316]
MCVRAGAVGAAGVFTLLIVVVWQVAATWRARMVAAREEPCSQLAGRCAELLEDDVEQRRRTPEELTQARTSIASMEKVMREIDPFP